jgi:hypothetical protein
MQKVNGIYTQCMLNQNKENMKKYVEENFSEPLVYFLECQFNVDVVPDYEEIKRIRTDSTFFPNVDRNAFRKNLIETIIENKLTPNIYEHLTNHELETQEEVNNFLINDIWKPLYGDEPIKA